MKLKMHPINNNHSIQSGDGNDVNVEKKEGDEIDISD